MGTNRLRHTPENVAFVNEAVEAGLDHIDTAHLYAGGESEATIGAALATGTRPSVVATKGGYRAGEGRPEVLREQIDMSLRRLRSEEHTSELQSRQYFVCRIVLEKKE